MVETGQRAQLGYFNRTNRNILDIERYERKKDGFVTDFHFHSFIIWHYLYKNLFSRTDRKIPHKGI